MGGGHLSKHRSASAGRRPHVLLLGGTSLAPLPAMRALKREGARVTLGLAEDAWGPCRASRFADAVLRHPPLADGCALARCLAQAIPAIGADIVMPMTDYALLAIQPWRVELERLAAVAAPPADCVALALDKGVTIERVRNSRAGMRIPRTILPSSASDAATMWQGPFPALLKPRTGTGTIGVRIVRDAEELRRAYQLVEEMHGPALVQEVIAYAPGDKFVLLYLFDNEGRLTCWCAQRVERECRAVTVGLGKDRQRGGNALLWGTSADDDLIERGVDLLRGLGWRGLCSVEGAFDRDGQPVLFEINPRLDGTGSLALSCGVNLVYDACLIALGRPPRRHGATRAGLRARKNLMTMIEARDLRAALAILDPRYRPPVPVRQDPVPYLLEAWGIVRKRLPWRGRLAAAHRS